MEIEGTGKCRGRNQGRGRSRGVEFVLQVYAVLLIDKGLSQAEWE